MNLRKAIFVLCVILSLILFCDGLYVLAHLNGRPAKEIGETRTKPGDTEDKTAGEPPVNLLILGLDEEEERSDVVVLLNYSPETGGLNILSIARDTRVRSKGRTVKINALVSMGGESLVAREVEELTGLPVHYYLTMNFKGFRKMVDALGGVEIDVPFNMNYDDPSQNLHIHLRKGRQVLNGKKAEQYVRYRKGNYEGQGYNDGDIGRIKAQQDFIKALLEQKLKVKYILKLDEIFSILKENMKTNIEIGDVRRYARGLTELGAEDVNTYTLPGDSAYIGKTWYFLYDLDGTREMIDKNFYK